MPTEKSIRTSQLNTRPYSRDWILIALFLVWVTFIMASYYLVQNAFLQPLINELSDFEGWIPLTLSASAVGRSLLDLLTAIWITLIALGIGRWFFHHLAIQEVTELEESLFSLGLGFGALGLLVLLFGLVGILYQPVFYGLAILFTALTVKPTWNFLRKLTIPRPHWLIIVLLATTILLSLSLALLPPTSWDGLFYHLAAPKYYLRVGIIQPGIDIPHFNYPALVEMNYLLALSIRGDVPAVLLHFAFALFLVGLVYLIAKELLNVANAWMAVLILLSIPMVFSLASWAYTDLALAFYSLAALYLLLKWRHNIQVTGDEHSSSKNGYLIQEIGRSWLILGAVFSGLAMGVKYTSFMVPLILITFIVWWYWRQLTRAVKPILLFCLVSLVVAAPWYLKNFVFTGNPVYPFVMNGLFWDDFRAAAYSETGTGIGFNPDKCLETGPRSLTGPNPEECNIDFAYLAKRLVTLPYDLTLGINDASRDGDTGPLFLVFLPLILFYLTHRLGNGRRADVNALLYFALIQYLFWTLGVIFTTGLWQSRLLLPAFVALCPALAWMLENLAQFDHPKFSLHRQLYLVIGLVLLVGIAIRIINWLPHQAWANLIGNETNSQHLTRRLGSHYLAMQAINEKLPDDAVVTFLWEPRSYYCDRECRPDSILDSFGHLQYLYHDASGIARFLKESGTSHILLFNTGLEFVLEDNSIDGEPLSKPAVLAELQDEYLSLHTSIAGGAYQLYRLND